MNLPRIEDRVLSRKKQYKSSQDEKTSGADAAPNSHGFTPESEDKQIQKSRQMIASLPKNICRL
jgi:sugar-specific transcriptional regulator TrmB